MTGVVAKAEIEIARPIDAVWAVLTTSGAHPEIMFGADVISDWTVGSRIVWRGEWNGTSFEDHGEILVLDAPEHLAMTHFSPMTGQPDEPQNYHRLDYTLVPIASGAHTRVTLEQDNNPDDEAAEHASENWAAMLAGVKAVAEQG